MCATRVALLAEAGVAIETEYPVDGGGREMESIFIEENKNSLSLSLSRILCLCLFVRIVRIKFL